MIGLLAAALAELSAVADLTPEYQGPDVPSTVRAAGEDLIAQHPGLRNCPAYLELLQLTGGAHICNRTFDFVAYGFGGYVVPSFEEGWFLDQERYFLFGEILYLAHPEPTHFLAFDLASGSDAVFVSPDEQSNYRRCSPSFIELLLDLAHGRYPGYPGTVLRARVRIS